MKPAEQWTAGRVFLSALGLWLLASGILAAVSVGATAAALWWFVRMPVLAVMALAGRR